MQLSAVLLAGGESRRLGRDKATVVFQGEPLWQRQLNLLQRINPAEILISARTEPSWRPPKIAYVEDAPPSRGPLTGIVAALAQMKGTHLLVLAVDMPFMSKTHLQTICHLCQPNCGIVPRVGDQAEGLAAIYPQESLNHLSECLKRGDLSLQLVTHKLVRIGMLSVFSVNPEEEMIYRSINLPADLASAV
jgi:molybdopterin-guanine dinucleotide biosynthesis protein A